MTSYNRVNSFSLGEDRLLFFDIFHKNDELVLIMPIYNKPVESNKIKITSNNILLKLKERIEKFSSEPILILKYNFISCKLDNEVKVEYEGKINTYNLHKMQTKINKTLTLTTLFKGDYELFNIFYDYYKKQGVEYFYLYYNGISDSTIGKLHAKKDVLLIDWNFVYWNKNCTFQHHAQMGQIHDALYKYGKSQSKYMIFCDYDEYLCCANKTLKSLVSSGKYDTHGFCNVWCKDKKEPTKIPTKFPNLKEVIMEDKIRFGGRSKCIHKISSILTTGIHSGSKYTTSKPVIDKNNTMYHFRLWSGKRKK